MVKTRARPRRHLTDGHEPVLDRSTPVVLVWPSISVIRSLGRLGVPVFCVDATGLAAATASRYCSGAVSWDLDTADPDESLEMLTRLAQTVGNRPVLLAADDHGALFVARHSAALAPWYRLQHPKPEVARALSTNRTMFELCRQLGVPTPGAVFPRSRADVEAAIGDLRFPVIVKRLDTELRERRRGVRMAIARDRAELLAHYNALEDPASPNLMLQEHVAGGPESVWIFNGYFDSDSRCLFGCTGRTLRQWPVWTGATSLGFCAPNPEIERMVIELMKAIEYHGPVEVGLRHDHREGRYRLLDVNPRIGGTFRLFLGDTGLDVARVMHLDLTGRPVPATGCSGGRRWNADLIRAAEFMREGELDGGHDPGPFARMTMALASSVVRRRARDLRPL